MGQKNKKLSPFGWTSADAFALCGSVRRQGRLAPQARASTLFNRKKEKNKMRSLEKRIKPAVASSKDVFSLVHSRLHKLEVEHLLVLHLDSKHRLTKLQTVSQGTRTECLVHPREVFCEAVRERSVAVIVCHNHPSGDAEPSRQDLDLTTRLFRAGELLGIPLLDHLIVGKGI
jgi:DNA repair protein RadC